MRLNLRQLLPALIATIALTGLAPRAHAQYQKQEPGTLDVPREPYQQDEVGVDESKLGTVVPGDLQFRDEQGQRVTLGSYLSNGRPIILWMGYYECPMLCGPMSVGMVKAVQDLKLDAGKEFAILNVSIDPNEVPGLAKAKKESYLRELGRPGDAAGWNLLTGNPEAIRGLATAVGYKFKKVTIDGQSQYAHPAVLMILSPQGKITRYLYPTGNGAIGFDSQTMRLSLIEASDGKVGSTVDRWLLTCLQYDSHTGKYTWIAKNLMKGAGGLTVLIMLCVFVPLWIRAARRPSDHDGGAAGSGAIAAG